jgi:hypothetical protein
MVCFNLRLYDYLEQYIMNKDTEHVNCCPVCYDRHLNVDHTRPAVHDIVDCYKSKLLQDVIAEYRVKYNQEPDITEHFIYQVWKHVSEEMIDYQKLNKR